MEINLNGQNYRVGRVDAIQQFHVARRLAPIQIRMGVSGAQLAKTAEVDEVAMMAAIMGPIADMVATMPEADVNYIINMAMNNTMREQGEGKWARVMVSDKMMFADIGVPQLMRLTIAFVQENLGGFFDQLPGA